MNCVSLKQQLAGTSDQCEDINVLIVVLRVLPREQCCKIKVYSRVPIQKTLFFAIISTVRYYLDWRQVAVSLISTRRNQCVFSFSLILETKLKVLIYFLIEQIWVKLNDNCHGSNKICILSDQLSGMGGRRKVLFAITALT